MNCAGFQSTTNMGMVQQIAIKQMNDLLAEAEDQIMQDT